MYFAILGKNKDLSKKEIEVVAPGTISFFGNNCLGFETETPEEKITLGGSPKRGIITSLDQWFYNGEIIGTPEEDFGRYLKKNFGVKRYKFIEREHTDKEIKEKGTEIIPMEKVFSEKMKIGIVKHYQHIERYEHIDFGKPVNGMEIGMMPAKLIHTMINIGIGTHKKLFGTQDKYTIYDPTIGFGTTCLMANTLGYNTIGSDINITSTKQNLQRRKKNQYYQDLPITLFKQDLEQTFTKHFLSKVDLVASEGWLGPVITHNTPINTLEENGEKIGEFYKHFFQRIKENCGIKTVIIVSLPTYIGREITNIENLSTIPTSIGYQIEECGIYARKGQFVGRKILLCWQK